jgi:tRNA (cmo5U34)-methyltransferase
MNSLGYSRADREAFVKKDSVMPGNKWEFNSEVTSCFDDMLKRSIPQYSIMRSACTAIAKEYMRGKTAVIDIGCSRGEAISELIPPIKSDVSFIGLEISEPMIQASTERFKDIPYIEIYRHDLRAGIPLDLPDASVILSILTIQFTPIEYRHKILKGIYDLLIPGGIFIFVEKVLGNTNRINEDMTSLYYDLKGKNGYSNEQIERKRLSLEGSLVPITARWNENLLVESGFTEIDCFWRWMNFAGWVAVK